jgi:glycosyltransferase involved in cell wall biosynthesis
MTHAAEPSEVTVDIICSVLNGGAFLAPMIASIQAQTHRAWRLWVRDDGSTDGTLATLDAFAAADSRITVLHRGGPALGCASAFGWLMERLPTESAYVMVADADDVWLSEKIAITLAAMQRAEAESRGPVLVHTDLRVVDAELRELSASFWAMAGIDPSSVAPRDIVQRNIATAPTVMVNRALRLRIGSTPSGLVSQDWWYACVAAVTGRIVAVPQATVQYRQHGGNLVGAPRADRAGFGTVWADLRRLVRDRARFRRGLAVMSRQATVLLERFGDEIRREDREVLEALATLPSRSTWQRKRSVARLYRGRTRSWLRALVAAARA